MIVKEFQDGDLYYGKISEILPPLEGDLCVWYKVVYEDGDQETMTSKEIVKYINRYLSE